MNSHTGIRPPAVAGQFYTDRPEALRNEVRQYIEDGRDDSGVPGTVCGMIVPHAGYRFSGAVAGKTYATISGQTDRIERVVVLAPSHTVGMDIVALSPHRGLETPLGVAPVDVDACTEMTESNPDLFVLNQAAHAREHSLEVQIPFIQALLPDAVILPAVCGQLDLQKIQQTARALARLWNPNTLWVVSSDFTHFGFSFGYTPFQDNIPERLRELDLGAVKPIQALDPEGFLRYVDDTGATICGRVPIALFLALAAQVEPRPTARLVEYTSSGALTGDFSHTVGYAGIVFQQ